MAISLEETLTDLWRQVLVEYADVVVLGTKRFPIRLTPKRRLREGVAGFQFLFRSFLSLPDQNPYDTGGAYI